jgi:hypothetical protein
MTVLLAVVKEWAHETERSLHKQSTCALKYTTPLFNIQAPTCFGSSLPSSGSFLNLSELLEMQIK